MARPKTEDTFLEKWEPSRQDAQELRIKLIPHKQEYVGGRLQTSFEMYCKTMGIISFDEWGNKTIHQPSDYHNLLKTHDKIISIKTAEQEEYLRTHPEEQEKFREIIVFMRPANLIKRM
jgi:hypothetical protein